jgi:hypothetical protein
MPLRWALYGAGFSAVQFGLLSYWMNSYWGGAPAATGGALLYGAVVRMTKSRRVSTGVALGFGLVLLANSRPYEGMLASVAPLVLLGMHFGRNRDRMRAAGRQIVSGTFVVLIGAVFTLYIYGRVTGNPLVLPYAEYARQYAASRVFVWQTPPEPPVYRHAVLRDAHLALLADHRQYDTPTGFVRVSFDKIMQSVNFSLGPMLPLPLLFIRRLLRNTRTRFLIGSAVLVFAGMLAAVPFQIHYSAPISAALIALGTQSLRYLCALRRYGNPVGTILRLTLPAASLAILITSGKLMPAPSPLRERPKLIESMTASGRQSLVFVRYGATHSLGNEWVYNDADIDRSPVVWARDMGHEANRPVLEYYRLRSAFLLQPDEETPELTVYTGR